MTASVATDPIQLTSNIWMQAPSTRPTIPESSGSLGSTDSSKQQASTSTETTTSASSEDDDERATQVPDADASMEDRIGYVISCAKQVGFDSLDSLVSAYYTRPFAEVSSLSAEQRISRHRRLPQVLAQLRQQITTWTQWERTGFEDEILRTAEDICGTTVTTDFELVRKLHLLYFSWDHPVCSVLSKYDFIKDRDTGSQRYCSPLLVNVIAALGCRFSDRVKIKTNLEGGEKFYSEAERLWGAEHGDTLITTIQATALMSLWEASQGRESKAYYYSRQAMSMAVEGGLHNRSVNEKLLG
jgi:hypothetical protein